MNVQAATLYEAAALAVRTFWEHGCPPGPIDPQMVEDDVTKIEEDGNHQERLRKQIHETAKEIEDMDVNVRVTAGSPNPACYCVAGGSAAVGVFGVNSESPAATAVPLPRPSAELPVRLRAEECRRIMKLSERISAARRVLQKVCG